MYRVVIVDDEPIIVEGLSKGLRWEKWGCQIVGTAQNGQDGMKLIREQKPDILFSDICMPGIDGLTMIAAIKSEFPDMQVSILTGFRDFDYAQTAIRLGVTRFILKPSKMDELEEAVLAMTEALQRQGLEAEALSEAEEENTQEETDDSVTGEEDSAASSFIVKNALEYIEDNYMKKLKLSDVAEKTYVSQWHLSKLLNRHTGQNFSEILNSIRIEKAKELLRDPSLRIGDIAESVGFLDMAHFSRVFKKQMGISANAYRNQILGK